MLSWPINERLAIFDRIGANGRLASSRCGLGAFWARIWGVLGRSLVFLGLSWGVLELPWTSLGQSWGVFGARERGPPSTLESITTSLNKDFHDVMDPGNPSFVRHSPPVDES